MTFDLDRLRACLIVRTEDAPPLFNPPDLFERFGIEELGPVSIPDDAALLTRDQAAAHLNITSEQLAAFIKDGALIPINMGRGDKRPRYRFTKQDLDAFVERRRQKEEVPCLSSSRKSRHSTTMPSSSVVIGFTARRNARLAKKPKLSKS